MLEKSLVDFGFDVLSKKKEPLKFADLFNEALKLSGLTLSDSEKRSKMSKFYTQLSTDERFFGMESNCWDLRSRHEFKKIEIDLYEGDSDDECDDEEEAKLLRQEAGEVVEESDENDDDLDFDKPVKDADDDDEDF